MTRAPFGWRVVHLPRPRDRLICDRKPQSSQESSVHRVFLPFCPRLRRLILQRSHALGFTSLTRAIAFTCTRLTTPVGTHKSLDHEYLPLGYVTSMTLPVTMSTMTIWKVGGGLICDSRLVTRNLMTDIGRSPSSV